LLLDAALREVGSLAGFADYGDDGRVAGFTPANHVGGWGKIDGRTAVVCAGNFYLARLVMPTAHRNQELPSGSVVDRFSLPSIRLPMVRRGAVSQQC
jgi:propionyl-CoA carboxylase beta chain